MNQIILYCRAGFEKELAAEITDKAANLGVYGFAKTEDKSAFVIFECNSKEDVQALITELPFHSLIFCRQWFAVVQKMNFAENSDRITPIIKTLKESSLKLEQFTDLWVETADTNKAKELLTFCRKFTVPLRQKMKTLGYFNIDTAKRWENITLHLFFTDAENCYLGYSYNNNHSPDFMGIKRLRSPRSAPSRSTLKLEEAIKTFLTPKEQSARLTEHHYAVDLGACPGGWTYQLVRRGLFVYAVDHGKIDESLMESGRVEHCSEDGFKFEPPADHHIDWLVCDMVEQPIRIAELIAKWLTRGWCSETIFNLKLPMKKRYEEVQKCIFLIEQKLLDEGLDYKLHAKHLYHDREEITVHIYLTNN
ncbi:23S rRNA (cytidine(2498)-2'-O)-methyltransferase RlmM [Gallibacterium anatis]|uniref:23S rRNA (cytidine(2498)-2'-O)-methyltransferase RlmM n=1 Tax=Gallibacterium anatis TaxID=750 RepID=UPI000530C4D8|nr:23S rRNA (cytidine(2498)-2'-O)-methyltransferase RlmM [Gallibacterium anatis]KGQ47611.1 ribosomal RNA large subunit methyltransferase M [Gallibacterium anatis 10672-6]KGQ54995.1 ribosomal RNA large subunit methyltransferase M [Gallibacterium anatis str. Avicor]UZD16109.1 23S rRNA (cytidine(2498)-2'-O)-methyltransferase RlmM [Gallibacterium anatis]